MPTSSNIPFIYRLTHLYIEPFLTIGGVILLLTSPQTYLSSLLPAHRYSDTQQPIFDQLAGAWLFLAFSEAIILRRTDDINEWKLHLAGLLCSDVFYFYYYYTAMGPARFWNPLVWRPEEWANIIATFGPFFRVAFLCNVGLGSKRVETRRKRA